MLLLVGAGCDAAARPPEGGERAFIGTWEATGAEREGERLVLTAEAATRLHETAKGCFAPVRRKRRVLKIEGETLTLSGFPLPTLYVAEADGDRLIYGKVGGARFAYTRSETGLPEARRCDP